MTIFFRWLNNPLVTASLLVFFSVLDLILLGRNNDLSKSDWAAWIQAVGSIAAIVGAIAIANRQSRIALREQIKQSALEELRVTIFARDLCKQTADVLGDLNNGMEGKIPAFLFDYYAAKLVPLQGMFAVLVQQKPPYEIMSAIVEVASYLEGARIASAELTAAGSLRMKTMSHYVKIGPAWGNTQRHLNTIEAAVVRAETKVQRLGS